MRLWHQDLIYDLPTPQLLGQHRECCALRGNGWGRKHSTVDYVFKYPHEYLYAYHAHVMHAMQYRHFKVTPEWRNFNYRGKKALPHNDGRHALIEWLWEQGSPIYPEHDAKYMQECLDNLEKKGAKLWSGILVKKKKIKS